MYQDTNWVLFDNISPQLEIKLHKLQIQASCQFNISLENIETDESLNIKTRKVCLQIRDKYLIQYDSEENLILSAIQLNFHTKIQIQDFNFQNSVDFQKCAIKIGRIKSYETNSMEDFSQQNYQQIPLQFSSEQQFKLKNFIIVLSTKSVIHEIKDLKKYFKPGKLLKSSEKSKIYEAYSTNKKQKFIIKAYPKQLLQKYTDFSSLLKRVKVMHMHRQNGAVRIQKVYSTKNTIYLILPAYQGNLYQFIKAYGNRINNSKKIMSRILKLFVELHDKMIVHGSISLEHILVNQQNGEIFQTAITGFQSMIDFAEGQTEAQKVANAIQESDSNRKFYAHAAKDIQDLGRIFSQLLINKVELAMKHTNQLANITDLSNQGNIPKSAIDLLQKFMINQEEQPKIKLLEIIDHNFFTQKQELFQNSKINKLLP